MIDEDGGNISQGQKQLICIARIMLTKPPMLILDEATSSIDTRTELQIQEAFETMMKGRTTFNCGSSFIDDQNDRYDLSNG